MWIPSLSNENDPFSLEVGMSPPTLSGLHHVTFPVEDLDASVAWFEQIFRAERLPWIDHRDRDGTLFAVIMSLPGLDVPLQLRSGSGGAASPGYEPVTFGIADRAELDRWVAHLNAHGVNHTPVINARIGDSVRFTSPDGAPLRLYTRPDGGVMSHTGRPS
jgi:catechol 2,3-dioxygenase-like lactoylglutathione lyase family enzyme